MENQFDAVDLIDVKYSSYSPEMMLKIKKPDNDFYIFIKSSSVVYFAISNSPRDMESPFIVDISLVKISQDIPTVLCSSGYKWIDYEKVETLTQIKVDGDVVIDILVEGEVSFERSLSIE